MLALALLLTYPVYALGPIPNGTYAGRWECKPAKGDAFDYAVTASFGDDSLDFEGKPGRNAAGGFGYLHSIRTFRLDPQGALELSSRTTNEPPIPLGKGSGFWTSRGLSYREVVMSTPGDETYLSVDGDILLFSSIDTKPEGLGRVLCQGRLRRSS